MLSEDELRVQLARKIKQAGGQTAWARATGWSTTYVNDLLKGRKTFSSEIADALGYERRIVYLRKRKIVTQ